MGSGAKIYIPDFIKIDSGIQKLIGAIHRNIDRKERAQTYFYIFFFQNMEGRLKSTMPRWNIF